MLDERPSCCHDLRVIAQAQAITAEVPLASMFGYATRLRSITQGRATYSMQFNSYQEVPESVSQEIVARVRGD